MSKLKKGERLTLSVSPAFRFDQYNGLKAHASVTVEIGDDPEADLARAREEIRRAYYTAVDEELNLLNGLTAAWADMSSVEQLAAYIKEKLGDVTEKASISVEKPEAAGQDVPAKPGKPTKPAVGLKAVLAAKAKPQAAEAGDDDDEIPDEDAPPKSKLGAAPRKRIAKAIG